MSTEHDAPEGAQGDLATEIGRLKAELEAEEQAHTEVVREHGLCLSRYHEALARIEALEAENERLVKRQLIHHVPSAALW